MLGSLNNLERYRVAATDGEIGSAVNFLFEDTWGLRHLVIDTSDWWSGKKVAIAPQWTGEIDWARRTVRVGLTRQAIKDSPAWPGPGAINREYEALLYAHHVLPAYWSIRGKPDAALHATPGNAPRA